MSYPNPIAIPINGGWRYNYGNMFYVQLVTQYLVTTEFDDDTVQAIMDEALKYEGLAIRLRWSFPDYFF